MLNSTRQRRKEARPQELLGAAMSLFIEKGFAATRIEEVAQAAGVSKGTLYLYYPSKEDLLKAVIRESLSSSIAAGRAILEQFTGPTAELVRLALNLWWERVGLTPASGICKLVMAEARNFPEMAEFFVAEVVDPGNALLEAVIQRGIDRGEFRQVSTEYTAKVMSAAMQFVTVHLNSIGACPGCTRIDPQRFIDTMADLVLHGLERPTATPAAPAP